MSQLRTALEYLTVGMDQALYGGANLARLRAARDGLYFPSGDPAGVTKRLKKMFPTLETDRPRIHALILSIQEATAGSDWLKTICRHNNQNKHASLSKVEPIGGQKGVAVGSAIGLGPGCTARMSNCVVDGVPVGVGVPITFTGDMPPAEVAKLVPGVPVTAITIGADFRLAGTKWQVVDLLVKARAGIGALANDVMAELGV